MGLRVTENIIAKIYDINVVNALTSFVSVSIL